MLFAPALRQLAVMCALFGMRFQPFLLVFALVGPVSAYPSRIGKPPLPVSSSARL